MNYLLVQPAWPQSKRSRDPVKYFPMPLLKLAGMFRAQGHKVAIIYDSGTADTFSNDNGELFLSQKVPFVPDVICITTVFSWWFYYVKSSVEKYHQLYPDAQIMIGGVHASLSPDLYQREFPYSTVHVGAVSEAEAAEPAWDLMPSKIRTQIIRYSDGCIRKCAFCYGWKSGYEALDFHAVSAKIRFNRLILNDNNLLAHFQALDIIKGLGTLRIRNKPISSVECQGGFDIRLMVQNLQVAELLKASRFNQVRVAWDGGFEALPMLKASVDALEKAGYHKRDLRCYCLYNYDLPYEVIVEKLRVLSDMGLGVIHSRFRPISLLSDGYIKQKREQSPDDYYIHEKAGWTDKKIRTVGSLASDISRQARAGKLVKSIDEIRSYYGRPSFDATVRAAA